MGDNMPPTKKFAKEEIIKVAFEIARTEGFEKLNARRIAKELNSSVNPIFNNFRNMKELKNAVYHKIYELYKSYMLRDIESPKAYKSMGLNYIKFAQDYPEFFKIIFMQRTDFNAENFCQGRTWWATNAFHFTDVTNAVKILDCGYLYK